MNTFISVFHRFAYRSIRLVSLCMFVLFVSCRGGGKTDTVTQAMPLRYAEGFDIRQHEVYQELIVWNPWQKGSVFARYYLVSSDTCKTPSDGIRIVVPVKRVAATACAHTAYIALLGQTETVAGVCSPDLLYDVTLRTAAQDGNIRNLGDALSMDVEQVIDLQPDLLLAEAYNSTDSYVGHLQRVGVPVVLTLEWMEGSLLARAEWLKFVAAFYDESARADSLFNAVADSYERLKAMASTVEERPTIMSGGNFRGTWYMSSGTGYMGRLFADAGADYRYASDTTAGSLPLTIETVLTEFGDADIWVGSSAGTLRELAAMDGKHVLFKAYKEGRVYNFNHRTTPEGANDFWETGIVQPDRILADLIYILHPDLLPDHRLFFAEKLTE